MGDNGARQNRPSIKDDEFIKAITEKVTKLVPADVQPKKTVKKTTRSSSPNKKENLRLKGLSVILSLYRKILEGFKKRDRNINLRNDGLMNKIELAESEGYREIGDLIKLYNSHISSVNNMNHLFEHQETNKINNVELLGQTLDSDLKETEDWINDYDLCLGELARKVNELQTYKDGGYHAHALKISELEQSIRAIDLVYKCEYEDLEIIKEEKYQEIRNNLTQRITSMYDDVTDNALKKVTFDVIKLADENVHLRKKVKCQEEYVKILKDKNRKVDSMIQKVLRDIKAMDNVHSAIILELSDTENSRRSLLLDPKARKTSNDDFKLDIPRIKNLPI